jgi:cold shock CspA family protein
MRYGTVVQFFPAKGFGFIRPDAGPDIFFHVTALGACQGQPEIKPGQPVKYELIPGTEPRSRRRRRDDEESAEPARAARPQAQLVELIDKIPGAVLQKSAAKRQAARHPRARQKKPDWRR